MSAGISIIAFLIVGTLMAGFVLFLSWAVRPLRKRPAAEATYECGFPAQGDNRNIGFAYFGYALLFLVFDLGAVYLFLIASAPAIGLPLLIGIALLLIALVTYRRPHAA